MPPVRRVSIETQKEQFAFCTHGYKNEEKGGNFSLSFRLSRLPISRAAAADAFATALGGIIAQLSDGRVIRYIKTFLRLREEKTYFLAAYTEDVQCFKVRLLNKTCVTSHGMTRVQLTHRRKRWRMETQPNLSLSRVRPMDKIMERYSTSLLLVWGQQGEICQN